MTRRAVGFLLVVLLSAPVTAQTPWQPPRTPDGQPDMQGIWRNDTWEMFAAMLSLEGDHSRWPAEFIIDPITTPMPTQLPTYIIEPADGKIPVGGGETDRVYCQHDGPDEAGAR